MIHTTNSVICIKLRNKKKENKKKFFKRNKSYHTIVVKYINVSTKIGINKIIVNIQINAYFELLFHLSIH